MKKYMKKLIYKSSPPIYDPEWPTSAPKIKTDFGESHVSTPRKLSCYTTIKNNGIKASETNSSTA
jgi:hypothetical protein